MAFNATEIATAMPDGSVNSLVPRDPVIGIVVGTSIAIGFVYEILKWGIGKYRHRHPRRSLILPTTTELLGASAAGGALSEPTSPWLESVYDDLLHNDRVAVLVKGIDFRKLAGLEKFREVLETLDVHKTIVDNYDEPVDTPEDPEDPEDPAAAAAADDESISLGEKDANSEDLQRRFPVPVMPAVFATFFGFLTTVLMSGYLVQQIEEKLEYERGKTGGPPENSDGWLNVEDSKRAVEPEDVLLRVHLYAEEMVVKMLEEVADVIVVEETVAPADTTSSRLHRTMQQ
jgi:hypothetical protein